MKTVNALALALAGLFLIAPPVGTHHSQAMYDRTKEVSVKGVVTKVEWTNPHTWFYMDATDAQGKVEKWEFEGLSPNSMTRAGWKKTQLKVGDQVTMVGNAQKDGVKKAHLNSVILSDGRVIRPGSDPSAI